MKAQSSSKSSSQKPRRSNSISKKEHSQKEDLKRQGSSVSKSKNRKKQHKRSKTIAFEKQNTPKLMEEAKNNNLKETSSPNGGSCLTPQQSFLNLSQESEENSGGRTARRNHGSLMNRAKRAKTLGRPRIQINYSFSSIEELDEEQEESARRTPKNMINMKEEFFVQQASVKKIIRQNSQAMQLLTKKNPFKQQGNMDSSQINNISSSETSIKDEINKGSPLREANEKVPRKMEEEKNSMLFDIDDSDIDDTHPLASQIEKLKTVPEPKLKVKSTYKSMENMNETPIFSPYRSKRMSTLD